MTHNEISYEIRGAIFEVYNTLGPGLLESVYQKALSIELKVRGLNVQTEVILPVFYKGIDLNLNLRMDIVVNDKVIIELKSVETLLPIHYKQLQTYLSLTKKQLGILVNFNTSNISTNIIRIANNLK